MQHCTGLYAATTMARSLLATRYFSAAELAEACLLASAPRGSKTARRLLQHSSAVARFPAWKDAKRPASALQPAEQLDIQWQLPLQQLQAAVQQHLQDTPAVPPLLSSQHTWQGSCFKLSIVLVTDVDAARSRYLGLYIRMLDVEPGTVRTATFKLSFTAAPGNPVEAGLDDVVVGTTRRSWTCVCDVGDDRALSFGALSSWQQAEAKLRQLGLVHSDGCLHVTGLVTNIELRLPACDRAGHQHRVTAACM
ncbi:hypothetical protein OEZ85_004988 [Tetradesmus obliquus]|uniref:Uncharacterized protein n=1 Tax=Tetradesmus obliquus TaxID=3088 RepID=A0ABY8UGH0_TETOB|nr:hypothetical protein OEZ85_004988 [Tetradesmus obliquus]